VAQASLVVIPTTDEKELTMERNLEQQEDALIDLGVVTEETKGAIGGVDDSIGLLRQTGLSTD